MIFCSRLSRSLKVIGTDADRAATYDFLLMFHNNRGPISYCFQAIARHWPLFLIQLHLTPSPADWVRPWCICVEYRMLHVEYQNNKTHDDFGGNRSGNMASVVVGWKKMCPAVSVSEVKSRIAGAAERQRPTQFRADNGSHFMTYNPRDPSVN